jgi:sporulation protein YlmC with PRC-barrel domain
MLILNEAISGKKIMSVHSGGSIATISEPVIDPKNLKIVAFSISSKGLKYFSVVHSSDIREWSPLGAIINSEDEIIEVDENMPKIRSVVEDGFDLVGIKVRTESGKRLGKVKNFVFETDGYFVVKLYIEKTGLLAILNPVLLVERDSVVDVTKKYLVVKDAAIKLKQAQKKKLKQNVEYGFSNY